MPVKHAFTSAKSDGSDATLIRPSNWNADHTGMPMGGWYNASDYNSGTKNATTIQAAIDAASAAGGGTVYIGPGVWSLGTTSLTIPNNNITLQGAGMNVTWIGYTGTTAGIKNSAVGTVRYRCQFRDFAISCDGASSGACCIENENFYWPIYERLYFECNTGCDGFRWKNMSGEAGYFLHMRDCWFVAWGTSSVCFRVTGNGANNGAFLYNLMMTGNTAQAIVADTTNPWGGWTVVGFNAEGLNGGPYSLDLSGMKDCEWLHVNLEANDYPVYLDSASGYNRMMGLVITGGHPTVDDNGNFNTISYLEAPSGYFSREFNGGEVVFAQMRVPIKAGVPSDSDMPLGGASGNMMLDTTNGRIYFRVGSTWKYATLT